LLTVLLCSSVPLVAQLDVPDFGAEPGQERPPEALDKFTARAIVSHEPAEPGRTIRVAVEMDIDEGFWIYGPHAGGTEVAAQDLKVEPGPSPLKPGEVRYAPPKAKATDLGGGSRDVHYVYTGRSWRAFVPVEIPPDLAEGEYPLPLRITGQVCNPGLCLQLDTVLEVPIRVGGEGVPAAEWSEEIARGQASARPAEYWEANPPAEGGAVRPEDVVVFGEVDRSTMMWLALAVLAGLSINILPCVLPVLPLRLLALLNQAKESRGRFIALGLAFAGGIVLFFAGIAAVNAVLRLAIGYRLVWGDMFRHTEAIVVMSLILVALALYMFDVFTINVPGKVAAAEPGQGIGGAVGMGLLMAVISTPCSAALIAGVFGWAQLQPLALGSVAILLMGLGMALPHVVLAGFPQLVAKIPRAGRWSGLFKQSVGFVFLGIAVWLLATRLENGYIGLVAGYAVVLSFCLWAWGAWIPHGGSAAARWGVRGGAAVLAVAAGWFMLKPPEPALIQMAPYDAAAISRAREEGRVVLVKFTAAWCVECLVVERKIYEDPEVAEALAERNVYPVKGDVTDRAMPASEMLYRQLGRTGPPVTALLPPGDGPPIVLPGEFSKEDLLAALEEVGAGP
jgi:thiol:disulfide interchange protein DsbD